MRPHCWKHHKSANCALPGKNAVVVSLLSRDELAPPLSVHAQERQVRSGDLTAFSMLRVDVGDTINDPSHVHQSRSIPLRRTENLQE